MTERHRHQNEVERLLAQIGERTRELRLLKTYGIGAAALGDRKNELVRTRQELAAIVGH
jgi:hypothetical protein